MPEFRISAKKLFITYPQCNGTKEELLSFIKSKKATRRIITCEERHEDGSPHLHCAVEFSSKFSTTNPRYFDWNEFHPNVQTCKNWEASVNYCKKDGSYVEEGFDEELNIYELARTTCYEEYMERCRKGKVSCMYATAAWKHARESELGDETITTCDHAGTIRPDLGILQMEYLNKNLWIKGPSGIGKTTWAKINAPKPALFVTHMDDLKKLRKDHKSIIFDDMSFVHLPRETQIYLVDEHNPRSIHVRYGTVKIPAGIQKIFLSNVDIFVDDEAIKRRYQIKTFI